MNTLSLAAQQCLVSTLMSSHPLPWRLEFDWLVEVTDAAGTTVIKCMRVTEANEIIAMAIALAALDKELDKDLEALFLGAS